MTESVPQLLLDAGSIVIGGCVSDILSPGAVAVDAETYTKAVGRVGLVRFIGGQLVAYAPPPPPVDLMTYAAAAHVARRDGGVSIGGMLVKTDSESRSLITGAYALSEAKPDAVTDFKAASGWITLNAAMMQTVAIGVGSWVQACYTAYRNVSDGITAGTITAPAQIDAAFAAVTLPS